MRFYALTMKDMRQGLAERCCVLALGTAGRAWRLRGKLGKKYAEAQKTFEKCGQYHKTPLKNVISLILGMILEIWINSITIRMKKGITV